MTARVKKLAGFDWKNSIEVPEGSFVVCLRSHDYSLYRPGEVMRVGENTRNGDLSLFHVTRKEDNRAFSGQDGVWAPHYVKQSLEELL